MEGFSYKLPDFEGPLDLLLHLIAKNKLSICEVQISSLLEQYLEHIAMMQEQDLDIASEFLEMASRLVHIKTVFLLPKHEEGEALEQELVGQLLEYQVYKEMAGQFASLFSMDQFVRQTEKLPKDPLYRQPLDPSSLAKAYDSAMGKGRRFAPPPMERISALVSRRVVSVTSQIVSVMGQLRANGPTAYEALFAEKTEKTEMVATFLAVLELIKGHRIRIEDTAAGSVVFLREREETR
ncbi:MAG: segregation/condensation protein A [Oscillospiraceae bacterium]|nr:segregation/condensation protein A [Oscillospiraceae bacterium]